VAAIQDVVGHFGDSTFSSPYRSTLPLLALIKDAPSTFEEMLRHCGLLNPSAIHFEYTVNSPRGKGRPSHTDAMVISGSKTLAIEAKWTEPRYGSIEDRLNRSASNASDRRNDSKWLSDQEEFLTGWLDLLGRHATIPLSLKEFRAAVYQMVHRSASACAGTGAPSLLYLHFSPAPHGAATSADYRRDLTALHRLLGRPTGFPFFLADLHLSPTKAFRAIQYLRKGERSTADTVRSVLLCEELFTFGEPRFHSIGD
jgi:hypothetical protein